MTTAPPDLPGQTSAPPPSGSQAGRAWRLLWHHPGMLRTLLREAWRKKWGIALDRRFRHGLSGPPVSLNLNLTRRCNLKCLMCEQHRHLTGSPAGLSWYDPARELPLGAWVQLLDQVASFRPRLYLTGGEPLLYPHFSPLVAAAKKRGLLIHLQTNGTLLAKAADLLVDQGVEMVTVSLDGPEEIHDRIRGQRGAFRRTRAGIAALAAARKRHRLPAPLLLLNCVISKASLPSLPQMVPLALELGADILQLQHTMFNTAENVTRHNLWLSPEFAQSQGLDLVPPSIPEGEFYESEITADDLPLLQAGLEEARAQARGRLKLLFLPALPAELLSPYYLNLSHPFPKLCQSLWKSCRILPDGTVSPCLHLVAGHLNQQSFEEIWNGPPMQRLRQLIATRLFPGCVRCCGRSFT